MNSLNNIARKLYAFSFFDSFVLIYPLYAVFFADSGISASQISLLFAAWSVSGFVLEIPSGSLADKYPRKNILFLGVLAKAVGFLFWLLFPNFIGFLIGFILWGVKSAFTSGTKEALVYDELSRAKQTKSYTKIMGRMDSLGLIGVILASIAAALIAPHGYTVILIMSALSVAISAILVLLLPTAPIKQEVTDARYFSYLKKGVGVALTNKLVTYLVLLLSFIIGFSVVEEYFALLLRQKGLDNPAIAFWSGAIFASAALGSFLAYKFKALYKHAELSLLFWSATLLLATVVGGVMAPLIMCAYMFVMTVYQIHVSAALQDTIPSDTRATTTSLSGLGGESFALLAYFIIGIATKGGNFEYGFRVMALGVLAGSLLFILFKPRKQLALL